MFNKSKLEVQEKEIDNLHNAVFETRCDWNEAYINLIILSRYLSIPACSEKEFVDDQCKGCKYYFCYTPFFRNKKTQKIAKDINEYFKEDKQIQQDGIRLCTKNCLMHKEEPKPSCYVEKEKNP